MNINPAIIVNAWTLPSNVRHEVIFRVLDALPPRQAVLLVNDHDPNPLFYQWDAEQPGISASSRRCANARPLCHAHRAPSLIERHFDGLDSWQKSFQKVWVPHKNSKEVDPRWLQRGGHARFMRA